MCGNLKAAMESIRADEFKNIPEVYRIFHATGRDLEKMGSELKQQSKEIETLKSDVSSIKEDVSGVKKDVAIVNAKVDTLTTVVVEMEKLIKDHFSVDHIKETVVGQSIIKGFHTKKFWLALLFAIALILLAGIGIYNILLTNPQIARDIVKAAAGV